MFMYLSALGLSEGHSCQFRLSRLFRNNPSVVRLCVFISKLFPLFFDGLTSEFNQPSSFSVTNGKTLVISMSQLFFLVLGQAIYANPANLHELVVFHED